MQAMKSVKACAHAQQIAKYTNVMDYLLNSVTVSVQSQRWHSTRMPVHDEGSEGMFFMGLQTGAGYREILLVLSDGQVIKIPCEPGHLFLCNLASRRYQVIHPVKKAGLEVQGLGFSEVALVVRSSFSSENKEIECKRLHDCNFYRPAMDVINKFLCRQKLRIPDMNQVIAEYEQHELQNINLNPTNRVRIRSKRPRLG